MDDRPIGMFDSGVGGLTVARAVIDVLSAEDLLYLGDSARGPFGPRPLEEVREFAIEIIDWLVREGVKMVVIACNTAAAAALDEARSLFRVPMVGVVEPALRAALQVTDGPLGMIGTQGTVDSGTYDSTLERLRPGTSLVSLACPGFVEFVESGEVSGPRVQPHVDATLAPMRAAHVGALVLGCTHYPLLARAISDAIGRDVTLISSADETAFEVADILARVGMSRAPRDGPGRHRFVCTGDTAAFRGLGRRFLGPEVESVQAIDLPRSGRW
ncbi:MAG: glutamate racemase [Actinobacteria bacterium ATB1]|nr:glutamate racemase [Actinobacteria bacterium ATB1]